MNKSNPKKVYAVLIICLALIASSFILSRKPQIKTSSESIDATNTINLDVTADAKTSNPDWSNMLTKTVKNISSTSTGDIKYGPDDFNPNLVTARMARDVFYEYLQAANNGSISQDQIDEIVNKTLSNPDYSIAPGVTYTKTNIKITSDNTTDAYKKYSQQFNLILSKRMQEVKTLNDPMAIMIKLSQSDDPKKLLDLDKIISATKGLIEDLVKLPVPSSIQQLHLGMINASSALLTDIQAMRNINADPVSSLIAIKSYGQHYSDFIGALGNINNFFKKI